MININFRYAVAALSASVVVSLAAFSAKPTLPAQAATVTVTDWGEDRNSYLAGSTGVIEEVGYIYERYLWHDGKTWRATGVRLVPSNFKLNKIVSSNSYSGVVKGTKKYNILRSKVYTSPVSEDKKGGYTVVSTDGKTSFHAWSYKTVYRYTITESDGTTICIFEPEVDDKVQEYLDTVGGTSAKEHGGGSGTQCVELPKHYIDEVFGCDSHHRGLGNGNTLYTGIARQYPDLFEAVDFYEGFIPEPGMILSLNGSDTRYGHAVIVKSVDVQNMTCTILEQWKGSGTVRTRTIPIEGRGSGTKNGIIGAVKIK